MAITTSDLASAQRERLHAGVTPFKHQVAIATTEIDNADDAKVLYFFGEEKAFLTKLLLSVSDMDGGTGLEFDIGIGDADGVVDTVIESGSTAGQAGGDVDASPTFPVDVTGKYLIFDPDVAAATAVAGTIDFYGEFVAGLRELTGT